MKAKVLLFLSILMGTGYYVYQSYQDNPVQSRVGHEIQLLNGSNNPVHFMLANFNPKHQKATLQIECNFSEIDNEIYLKRVTEAESILKRQGIQNINYQIVNRTDLNSSQVIPATYSESDFPLLDTNSLDQSIDSAYNFEDNPRQTNDPEEKVIKSNHKDLLQTKRGTINFDFVRLRQKPDLNTPVQTFLFRGTVVKVKAQSDDPQIIGGVSSHWYSVETNDGKQGWVYGHYLSETKEKNISSSLQNNLIYKDFIQKKKLLIPTDYQDTSQTAKNLTISSNTIKLKLSPDKILTVPYKINNNKVNWSLNEINLKLLNPSKTKQEMNEDWFEKDTIPFKDALEEEKNRVSDMEYYRPQKMLTIQAYPPNRSNRSSQGQKSAEMDFPNKAKQSSQAVEIKKNGMVAQTLPTSEPKKKFEATGDYNLKTSINPYIKVQLVEADEKKAEAILKVVEALVMTQTYKNGGADVPKEKRGVQFHTTFNPFYDTIEVTILGIDFIEKKATIEIKRVEPAFQVGIGPKEVVQDIWQVDFKDIQADNKKIDYDNLGDIYYSDLLLYLTRAGSRNKDEIIGLSNFIVELLMKQIYL